MDFEYLNTPDLEYKSTLDLEYLGLTGSLFGPRTHEYTSESFKGIRCRIHPSDLDGGSSGLVTITVRSINLSTTVSDMYIGLATNDTSYNFVPGTQTPVTFNGGNSSITLSPFQDGTSDPILFTFTTTDRVLISFNQDRLIMVYNTAGSGDTMSALSRCWAHSYSQPNPASDTPPDGGTSELDYLWVGIKEIKRHDFIGFGTVNIPVLLANTGSYYDRIEGTGSLNLPVTLTTFGGESRDAIVGSGAMDIHASLNNAGWTEIIGTGTLKVKLVLDSGNSTTQFFMNF